MATSRFFAGFLILFLLCAPPSRAAAVPASTATYIPSVRANPKGGATATVRVSKGTRRVTLWAVVNKSWVKRGVAHLNGTGGDVTFKVAATATSRTLRAVGSATDSLPTAFFKGKTNFAALSRVKPAAPSGISSSSSLSSVEISANTTAPTTQGNSTAVVEADIWKINGNTLYFFNQYRGLQIIDISSPDAPVLKSRLSLPAVGEDMYVPDPNHVVLLARKGSAWDQSEAISVVLTSGTPSIAARLPINGSIDTSRMVGTALYVISNGYNSGTGTAGGEWGTQLSSFDFTDPASPVARNTLWFSGWGNVAAATDSYLFTAVSDPNNWSHSNIEVVDISATDGTMVASGTLAAAGLVQDKFKIGLSGSVLTVISAVWAQDWSGSASSRLETFSLADPTAPAKLGDLVLGSGEWLNATRFDGNRAYVVTSAGVDPLWIVDLSNPATPTVTGSLAVPGFSTYLQPLGNRLLTLGIVSGQVAVSLFDVADPTAPALLSRVTVGKMWSWSEANFDEKAFTVLPDAGLILLPVNSYDSQTGEASQVQLVDLAADSLTQRGMINAKFSPRRATVFAQRILSISGQELLTVDATNEDAPAITDDVALAWPVNRVFVEGDYIVEVETGGGWWDQSAPALRVANISNPDAIITGTDLAGAPICGAAVRDGKLYLAQANTTRYYGIMPLVQSANLRVATSGTVANTSTLTVSIFDLSALPNVTLTGTTSAQVDVFSSNLAALWPSASTLVWATENSTGYWGGYVLSGGVVAASNTAGGGLQIKRTATSASVANFCPWWWGGGSDAHLFAFNVSTPAAPAFLTSIAYAKNAWSVGSAFAGSGIVFSSHTGANQVTSDWGWQKATNGSVLQGWGQGWFVDAIDFTNPAAPVVRDPISIPSKLIGVSLATPDGAVLYSLGSHADSTDGLQYLDASAYDSVSASLVDSVKLGNASNPAVVDGTNVFVGSTSGTQSAGTISTFAVSSAGKFGNLGTVTLTDTPWELHAINDLLAVRIGDGIDLFDKTAPAALQFLGTDAGNEAVSGELDFADGNAARGLWIPLDDYGVEFLQNQP